MTRTRLNIVESLESRRLMSLNFLPAVQNPLLGAAVRVATGDVTGDGNADLAIIDSHGIARVATGWGDGHFYDMNTSPIIDAGPNATDVVIADLNRDNLNDLIFTNGAIPASTTTNAGSPGAVTILMNLGNHGAFATPIKLYAGADPRRVAVGDVNGDGKLDIATADAKPWALPQSATPALTPGGGVLLGNGDGTFQGVMKVNLPGAQDHVSIPTPSVIATPGANRFVAWSGRVTPPHTTTGSNTGSSTTGSVLQKSFLSGVTFGVTGGGNPVTNNTFRIVTITPFTQPVRGLIAMDFNGDGRPDLAALATPSPTTNAGGSSTITNAGASVYTFKQNVDGSFAAPSIAATRLSSGNDLAMGDFDRDGKLDLAAAGATVIHTTPVATITGTSTNAAIAGGVSVLLGQGDGAFAVGQVFSVGSMIPLSLAAGNVDADNFVDLVAGGPNGAATLLNRSGNATTATFRDDGALSDMLSDPDLAILR